MRGQDTRSARVRKRGAQRIPAPRSGSEFHAFVSSPLLLGDPLRLNCIHTPLPDFFARCRQHISIFYYKNYFRHIQSREARLGGALVTYEGLGRVPPACGSISEVCLMPPPGQTWRCPAGQILGAARHHQSEQVVAAAGEVPGSVRPACSVTEGFDTADLQDAKALLERRVRETKPGPCSSINVTRLPSARQSTASCGSVGG
jgi:hypothetical protein